MNKDEATLRRAVLAVELVDRYPALGRSDLPVDFVLSVGKLLDRLPAAARPAFLDRLAALPKSDDLGHRWQFKRALEQAVAEADQGEEGTVDEEEGDETTSDRSYVLPRLHVPTVLQEIRPPKVVVTTTDRGVVRVRYRMAGPQAEGQGPTGAAVPPARDEGREAAASQGAVSGRAAMERAAGSVVVVPPWARAVPDQLSPAAVNFRRDAFLHALREAVAWTSTVPPVAVRPVLLPTDLPTLRRELAQLREWLDAWDALLGPEVPEHSTSEPGDGPSLDPSLAG